MRFSITYIHHDCFLLTTPDLNLIFDFWKESESSTKGDMPEFLENLDPQKPLYVMVSHFHKDHYNPDIFKWETKFANIKFIVSRDVARHARYLLRDQSTFKGFKPSLEKVVILSKGEKFSDNLVNIHAFGSTDIGNSYVLLLPGDLKVFHAGDLNCWTWRDESTPEEIRAAENAFRSELKPIVDGFPVLDVAMFPVDARIGSGYEEGARIFLEKIDVKRFFPMHFSLGESPQEVLFLKKSALAFKSFMPSRGVAIGLTSQGDSFTDCNEIKE